MSYRYGQFTAEHLSKMKEGIELFNEQKYWECHEFFEELWLEDTQDQARNVYWAIIQVAAAMVHFRNSNLVGVHGLIEKSKEKFKRCEVKGVETPILFQYLDWEELKGMVMKLPKEPKEVSDYQEVYDWRFKSYKEFEDYL